MLATRIEGLVLEPLGGNHAPALHRLMQANRAHLTAFGDFGEQLAASEADLRTELDDHSKGHRRFGIFLAGDLVGQMDILAVDPPRYSLGYWLAEGSTGKGYASAALQSLSSFARDALGASDLYAGVTHGNLASMRLLERAGFILVERFERYARYHLALGAP